MHHAQKITEERTPTRAALEERLTYAGSMIEKFLASRTLRPEFEERYLTDLQLLQDHYGFAAGRPYRQYWIQVQRW